MAKSSQPIQFAFYSCAVDDPNVPRSVFAALGRAAMAWGRLETHLDALIFQINKADHSIKLHREHPVSFDRKIELIKSWFNKHPALASHKKFMRDLTSTFKILSKEARNPTFHSLFARYDAARKDLILQTIKYEGNDTFKMREEKVNVEYLKLLTKTINSGNVLLSQVSKDLLSSDGIRRLRTP